MSIHIESRREQFASSFAGKVRRDDRRKAIARKTWFLTDALTSRD